MGKLVPGSDGLPAEEVGKWVEEKHFFVTEYIKLSHGARLQFIGPRHAGAAYIDLFCGPGQGRIKGTKQYVDGAAVAAWNTAKERGSPFTAMYIADRDEVRRDHCATRLRKLVRPFSRFAAPPWKLLPSCSRCCPHRDCTSLFSTLIVSDH